MEIIELLILICAPILRSVGGWLENALKDGQIDNFEWGNLGATILRVGVISVGLFYGLDLSALAAAGSALVADFIIMAIKKAGQD